MRYTTQIIALIVTFLCLLGIAVYLLVHRTRETDKPLDFLNDRVFRPDEASPARILNLINWKLTLPVSSKPGSSVPLEITQPALSGYVSHPWFATTTDKKGVIFRAPVNAPTTGNSDYPRSELREMTEDGKENIFWSSQQGTHTFVLDQAITAVPKKKPHIVAGQIHGDDDDLLVVRLEYPVLAIVRGKKSVATLDEHYVLGTRFTIKFVATDGQIRVYYNNMPSPVYVLDKKFDEGYFKAGVYTQSNCETEESSELCAADNYGEIVIYQLHVTHE